MYNPQLETFLRVADAGSFNKAAEEPEDRVERETAQSAADTAAQPATEDKHEPALMPVLMPGA